MVSYGGATVATTAATAATLPHLSGSGRSNAGLVIQLQNDMASGVNWVNSPVITWKQRRDALRDDASCCSAASVLLHTEAGNKSPSNCSSVTTRESICSSKASSTSSTSTDGRNATLPSPESAYSTGCSADISPSQDDGDALTLTPHFRMRMHPEAEVQSPRMRPAIRTNPWVSARSSLTLTRVGADVAGSGASGASGADVTDVGAVADLPSFCSDGEVQSDDNTSAGILPECGMLPAGSDPSMDSLCDSLEQLMDDNELNEPPEEPPQQQQQQQQQVSHTYFRNSDAGRRSHPAGMGSGPEAKRWEIEIDEQYAQLIRETEEILTQLENDEFMIFSRKPEDRLAPEEQLQPVVPRSVAGGRKKMRKCAAMRRASRQTDAVTSSESEVDHHVDDWMAGSKPDWRRMHSAHHQRLQPPPPQHRNYETPPRLIQHPHSRFSALDEWHPDAGDVDDDMDDDDRRPPSPAPMDPQCHRPNFRRKPAPHPEAYWSPTPEAAQFQWRNAPADAYTPASKNDRSWMGSATGTNRSAVYYWKEVEGRKPEAVDETLRKTLLEQQRLESQIAFLRRQLMRNVADVNKYVDDMAYDDVDDAERWAPSSDSSSLSYDARRRQRRRRRRHAAKSPPHRFRPS